MCKVSRRELLIGGSAFLSLAAEADLLAGRMPAGLSEAAKEDLVAPDVYFHEGDIADTADAVCNNGWIMFEDYVLVIDANYPAGARLIISKIRALTDKPIRFAFDTHHHGDHAYGNQIFVENGGVPQPLRRRGFPDSVEHSEMFRKQFFLEQFTQVFRVQRMSRLPW